MMEWLRSHAWIGYGLWISLLTHTWFDGSRFGWYMPDAMILLVHIKYRENSPMHTFFSLNSNWSDWVFKAKTAVLNDEDTNGFQIFECGIVHTVKWHETKWPEQMATYLQNERTRLSVNDHQWPRSQPKRIKWSASSYCVSYKNAEYHFTKCSTLERQFIHSLKQVVEGNTNGMANDAKLNDN